MSFVNTFAYCWFRCLTVIVLFHSHTDPFVYRRNYRVNISNDRAIIFHWKDNIDVNLRISPVIIYGDEKDEMIGSPQDFVATENQTRRRF